METNVRYIEEEELWIAVIEDPGTSTYHAEKAETAEEAMRLVVNYVEKQLKKWQEIHELMWTIGWR